jgi:hypothetical protein
VSDAEKREWKQQENGAIESRHIDVTQMDIYEVRLQKGKLQFDMPLIICSVSIKLLLNEPWSSEFWKVWQQSDKINEEWQLG